MKSGNQEAVINLHGGYALSLRDPDYSGVSIRDVAHALANICRFTGHVNSFYSVAEHSVLGSQLIEPGYALQYLLHDGHEFVIGDVSSPLKRLLPEYREIEALHERRFRTRFDLPEELDPAVKLADLRMLAVERDVLLQAEFGDWSMLEGIKPFNTYIFNWKPEEAEKAFLLRYHYLTGL